MHAHMCMQTLQLQESRSINSQPCKVSAGWGAGRRWCESVMTVRSCWYLVWTVEQSTSLQTVKCLQNKIEYNLIIKCLWLKPRAHTHVHAIVHALMSHYASTTLVNITVLATSIVFNCIQPRQTALNYAIYPHQLILSPHAFRVYLCRSWATSLLNYITHDGWMDIGHFNQASLMECLSSFVTCTSFSDSTYFDVCWSSNIDVSKGMFMDA